MTADEKLDMIIARLDRMEESSDRRAEATDRRFNRIEKSVNKVVVHEIDIRWMKRLSGYAAGLATTLAFWVLGKSFPH